MDSLKWTRPLQCKLSLEIQNDTLVGKKLLCEIKKYGVDIVGLTVTQSMGSLLLWGRLSPTLYFQQEDRPKAGLGNTHQSMAVSMRFYVS